MSWRTLKAGEGVHDQKIMAYVDLYWSTEYRPPSIREIMEACGISSTSATRYALNRLARGGKYIMIDKAARGIVPVWVKQAIQRGVTNG